MTQPSHSYLEEIPFSHHLADGGLEGELEITDHLLVPEGRQVRISVLSSVADVLTGVLIADSSPDPKTAMTVDLSVRIFKPITAELLQLRSRIVKRGRTLSTAEAWFHRDGQPVAHAWATFMLSPRPQDTMKGVPMTKTRGEVEMSQPFTVALGFDTIEPGVVEVKRSPYTLQPAGTIHGGVVCALAEDAALSLTGRPVTELDVRYLSTIRIGPARATAAMLHDNVTKVTVVDAGRDDDRIASVAFARG